MSKVITFGELMLRLAPEGYLRFVQSDKYEATFGGASLNISSPKVTTLFIIIFSPIIFIFYLTLTVFPAGTTISLPKISK